MNNFKKRKISTRPKRKPLSEKAKQNLITALGIILLILVVYWSGLRLLERVSGSKIFGLFSGLVGKELVTDSTGHTTILLLGVGGEGHEGRDLTDTMIVATLNQRNHTAALLSIPRDLYVEADLYKGRINGLYEFSEGKLSPSQSLDFMRDTVQKTINIPINYVMKVDFKAFEKAVDSVDGIDVFVEKTIDDPLYPKGETFEYEPFYLPAGLQHLDGATALKYVRSRKSSSDFDRSKRQQQVLVALKQKAEQENILQKTSFIEDLYASISQDVVTDMSIREMLSLASFAAAWKTDSLVTSTLNDEPSLRGGFLYTPSRELYAGAFVLRPAGETFDSIQKFAALVLYADHSAVEAKIAILNGTKKGGLAGTLREALNRFGFNVVYTGNAESNAKTQSTWYPNSADADASSPVVNTVFKAPFSNQTPDIYRQNPKLAKAKFILELGADAPPIVDSLDIFKNIVLLVQPDAKQPPLHPSL